MIDTCKHALLLSVFQQERFQSAVHLSADLHKFKVEQVQRCMAGKVQNVEVSLWDLPMQSC